MSLPHATIGSIPEETARVARAAFRGGNVAMRVRDVLGSISTDAAFAPLFAVRGQPAESPWRLALVTVLQFAEGLSDRQAADAVRILRNGRPAGVGGQPSACSTAWNAWGRRSAPP